MCYNVHGGGDGYDLDGLVCAIDECDPDVVYVGERPIYGKELYDKLVDRYGGNVMSFQEEIVAGKLPLDSRVELIRFSGGNVQQIYMCVSDLWISVSCCHMSSNNYQSGKYVTPDSLETVHGLRRYVANIDTVSLKRTECAEKIGETIDPCCMGPTIVMGDMNDVARSPALEVFRRYGLKDAWWRGGFGYGATIHKPLPFRIDHILYGGGLKLVSCKKIKSKGRGKDGRPLSDHDGLVAEFEIVR